MNLLDAFREHWKNHFPKLNRENYSFIIAVSGGIDSIVLTDLMHQCGFHFAIAHCNFQLREDESIRDETFVQSLEIKYQQPVHIKKFNTKHYAEQQKISVQEAARDLRYAWFAELIKIKEQEHNSDKRNVFLLTAHHADDNIETIMMHFFRGTGITGLTGIPVYDEKRKLIRPLLFASKELIINYAKEQSLQWVEDSSNATDHYTRNFFRNQLLPSVAEIFPQVNDNLADNIHRFTEAEIIYRSHIELLKKKLVTVNGNELHIPVRKWLRSSPITTITYELVKDFGFYTNQVKEIIKLGYAENGSSISSTSHRIIRNRNWLIIAPLAGETASHILIESLPADVSYSNGVLKLAETNVISNHHSPTGKNFELVDASEIKFPLLLRKWKQGDYFYPLGMHKKKKLSRFFIDNKLSLTEKEKVWILESNKKIIYVMGYRIDDRFKIKASTQKLIKIELM